MGSKSDEIDQAIQESRQGIDEEGEAYIRLTDYRERAQGPIVGNCAAI